MRISFYSESKQKSLFKNAFRNKCVPVKIEKTREDSCAIFQKKKNWCEVKRPLYSLAWWRRQVEKEIHQYETQRAKVILADFILSWTIGLSSE